MKISTYQEAIDYLYKYIPYGMQFKFPGDHGLKRTEYLLEQLGSPQNKLKVIHIAGTSGKGSTAFLLSLILRNAGFDVGLHISPHLIDLRERFQINNQLISDLKFCEYLSEITGAVEKTSRSKYGLPTYFEVVVALAYYIFYKEKVDYAVVEAGLGGLLDGTNVVDRPDKLAVITRIGFDHMEILGNTLTEIATQKAGIIQNKNVLITLRQSAAVNKVFEKAVAMHKGHLYVIKPSDIKVHPGLPLTFTYKFLSTTFEEVQLHMVAEYQVENSCLAIAAVMFLSQRDKFPLEQRTIKKTLARAIFPGRMQIFKMKNKSIIIDGAHNPQKMAAFTKSLSNLFPDKKFTVLLAMKKGKDYRAILKYIVPLADEIVITTFFSKNQGLNLLSESPEVLKQKLEQLKFKNYEVIPDTKEALKYTFMSKEDVVVTGSLYLLSEIYPLLQDKKIT